MLILLWHKGYKCSAWVPLIRPQTYSIKYQKQTKRQTIPVRVFIVESLFVFCFVFCFLKQRCSVSSLKSYSEIFKTHLQCSFVLVFFKNTVLCASVLSPLTRRRRRQEKPASGEIYKSCSKTYEGISYNQIYWLKTVSETGFCFT